MMSTFIPRSGRIKKLEFASYFGDPGPNIFREVAYCDGLYWENTGAVPQIRLRRIHSSSAHLLHVHRCRVQVIVRTSAILAKVFSWILFVPPGTLWDIILK